MKCRAVAWTKIARRTQSLLLCAVLGQVSLPPLRADSDVYILDVPTYDWQAGCFGTATGTLFGFWDRNGFPNLYTGPTGGGVAPLNNQGGNAGIRSLWASQAGFDGRSINDRGHMDDYWDGYESYSSTVDDPYFRLGRAEHEPDCIGDFIGLNQKKWSNMNGECDGNIDGYSFNYWDVRGNKRINYTPSDEAGAPGRDIQSGLRAYSHYCGYDADVMTQLAERSINPKTPTGQGFTWEELKQEINSGYPMLVFLQDVNSSFRTVGAMSKANPEIHGMLIYGYQEIGTAKIVHVQTSWGYSTIKNWTSSPWLYSLSIRGIIAYHPKPRIEQITRDDTTIRISWIGPSAQVYDAQTGATTAAHWYILERSEGLNPPSFQAVAPATTQRSITLSDSDSRAGFYRVRVTSSP